MELRGFYFHHPEMFMVPVEHLSPKGVDPAFAEVLQAERGLGPDWVGMLDRAIADYFERVPQIFARARRTWFPPRLQNLCVVTQPERTRPYYQPFDKASWLVYASDFDPEHSSRELAVYQLVHAERMGLVRNLQSTLLQNLSWFLLRSEEEAVDFEAGARRSNRPDADAFVALAEALPWIRELYHAKLRPPLTLDAEPLAPLPGTELVVTEAQAVKLRALVDAFEAAANRVVERYFAWTERADTDVSPAQWVCGWLKERRPQLLLADRDGKCIWDCEQPESIDQVGAAIEGFTEAAAKSLCDDLAVVSDRTLTFLEALNDLDTLPHHGEEVEQENDIFLHENRRLIVYSLEQPGLDTRREPSPPYHRLLVGARTMHEWGHLACDGGFAGLDPEKNDEHEATLNELGALLDAVIENAPEAFAKQVQAEFDPASLRSMGQSMARAQLGRMQDYLSNKIAQRLLPTEEMEAYVRANVKTLAQERRSMIGKLPRYAYEYQYLGFSKMADPRRYFFETTWFAQHYFETGLMTRDQAEQMLDLMSRVCACYRVDPEAFASR